MRMSILLSMLGAVAVSGNRDLELFMVSNAGASPFTVAMGDARGTFYQYQHGSFGQPEYYYCQAYLQYSTSKFITAATISHAILHEDNTFGLSLDSKVYEFIPWWSSNAADPRSKITLSDLLSQGAGLDIKKHAKDGWDLTSCGGKPFTMESCANYTYTNLWCKEGMEQYNEPNFLTAQFMTMQAFGVDSWIDILTKYFGEPLGLIYLPHYQHGEDGHLNLYLNLKIPEGASDDDRCKYFGMAESTYTPGGAGMIMSSTTYSTFLAKYLSGEYATDRTAMETQYSNLYGYGYGLGLWVMDPPTRLANRITKVWGSEGAMSANPMWVKTSDGKEWWIYVNQFTLSSTVGSTYINPSILDHALTFFDNLPSNAVPMNLCSKCDTVMPYPPTSWNPYQISGLPSWMTTVDDMDELIAMFGDYGYTYPDGCWDQTNEYPEYIEYVAPEPEVVEEPVVEDTEPVDTTEPEGEGDAVVEEVVTDPTHHSTHTSVTDTEDQGDEGNGSVGSFLGASLFLGFFATLF